MAEWLLIIPWATVGFVVYYFFLDRVGSKLCAEDPTLYNQIKEGTVKIEDQITAEENTKKQLENQLKTLEQNKTDGRIKEEDSDYKRTYLEPKAKSKDNIAKSEAKLALYQEIRDKGLDGIDFSLWNLGKGLGIFFGVGIVLHIICKKAINLIWKTE